MRSAYGRIRNVARVGHERDVGEAGHLVDAEAAARGERAAGRRRCPCRGCRSRRRSRSRSRSAETSASPDRYFVRGMPCWSTTISRTVRRPASRDPLRDLARPRRAARRCSSPWVSTNPVEPTPRPPARPASPSDTPRSFLSPPALARRSRTSRRPSAAAGQHSEVARRRPNGRAPARVERDAGERPPQQPPHRARRARHLAPRAAPAAARAAARVSLDEGSTPLARARARRRRGRRRGALRKGRGAQPDGDVQGSLPRRLRERGADAGAPGIVCASTGNAGASAAAYGARAGLPVLILVPTGTPPAKLAQAAVCGGRVVAVEGTYSDAHALARALGDDRGWLNATTTFVCPHVVTGARTVAFELAEAVGAPDWVVVPIGAGPLLVGVHEGYAELVRRGLVVARAAAARGPADRLRADRARLRGAGSGARVGGAVDDRVRPRRPARGLRGGGRDHAARDPRVGRRGGRRRRRADARGAAAARPPARACSRSRPARSRSPAIEAARRAGTIGAGETVVAVLTGTGLKTPQAAFDATRAVATVRDARRPARAARRDGGSGAG